MAVYSKETFAPPPYSWTAENSLRISETLVELINRTNDARDFIGMTKTSFSFVGAAATEAEFASEVNGYTATKHQREVGTSYFDAVVQTISGGQASTGALSGSTEEDQFHTETVQLKLKRADKRAS